MSTTHDRTMDNGFGYHVDPEATAHDLMNEALEWQQYVRGLTGLLAELIHEADSVDCKRMALALEAIGALTHMGVQCTAHAHVRMCWDKSRAPNDSGLAPSRDT